MREPSSTRSLSFTERATCGGSMRRSVGPTSEPNAYPRWSASSTPGSKSARGRDRPRLNLAPPRPRHAQAARLENGIVDPTGGALTKTCSPHLERATVSLPPPEAVEVSRTGSVAPLAERVSVLANAGAELVAAVFHFRVYTFLAGAAGVYSFVPLAAGRTLTTEETVIEAARSLYWVVPALRDTQLLPTFFTSAAVSPKRLVSPDELPDK